jgi:hypothetical protein
MEHSDMGASANADRATAVEPVPVSPLRDGIPSAEASVNDIPDNELLGRAVRNCRDRLAGKKSPRWVAVSDTFVLGSTYSRQLCRRFGVDPDEMVGRRR